MLLSPNLCNPGMLLRVYAGVRYAVSHEMMKAIEGVEGRGMSLDSRL